MIHASKTSRTTDPARAGSVVLYVSLLMLFFTGCTVQVKDPTAAAPQAWAGNGQWADPGPFPVAAMRIYPLTRLDRNRKGRPILVLHLELTDQWGDTTKGVGQITVRAVPLGGAAGQQEEWTVSLGDMQRNASLYDASSRTYRLVLGDLPEWLGRLAPDDSGVLPDTDTQARIDVDLQTPASNNQQRRLTDSTKLGN